MAIKFRPVRGTESQIEMQAVEDGYIYFATDSGHIYIDKDGERKSMGGTGIAWYYADQSTVEQDDNDYFILSLSRVDASNVKINDLIINTDGAFYKVLNYNSNGDYMCSKIAVSGSGGGGGGGPVVTADTRIVRTDSWKQNQTFIYGQDFYIQVGAESDVDDYIDLAFLVTQNGVQVEAFSVSIENGQTYSFNTKRLPKGSGISIQVQATSINSTMEQGPKQTINNLTTVELVVNKDSSFTSSTIASGNLNLAFLPKSNGLYQTLHVNIDGEELDLNSIQENKKFLSFKPTNSTVTVIIPEQSHGVHNIELYTSVIISEQQLNSDVLSYEIAWKDAEETSPVIWIGDFNPYVVNYNEAIIPFMVYNPITEANAENTQVYLYCNGVEIPTSPMEVSYDANNWINWDVTNLYSAKEGTPGQENTFKITCGTISRTVKLWVTTDGARDLGLIDENALMLNLSSTGRYNTETTTSRSTWTDRGYSVDFNNFNWYNNGWFNDNDGNGSYLSIANGASAQISLGDLILNSTIDYSFELRFRVRNIQEYSTLIKTIPYYKVEENDQSWPVSKIKEEGWTIQKDKDGNLIMDEEESKKVISQTAGVVLKYLNNAGEGFCVGTQEAYFHTPANTANVRYKEDTIINLAFVVSKKSGLLSIYLNGILSGALSLNSVSSITMTTENKLEINSEFCDIDIFKIRIYRDRELTMPDVIHNYISDIHDINLYDQNQLTADADGTILLYSKLLEYNEEHPDALSMPYAVWELIDNDVDASGIAIADPNKGSHGIDDDKLPIFKGNNRYCKIDFVNPALDAAWEAGKIDDNFYKTHSPSYCCIGADINVQGTSSQAYPRRNFKTKMKSATGKKDSNKVTHEDWGWFYTGGPYKEDWQRWLTTGDEEAKAACAFKKWNMDNTDCATNKFTWKIDYMESSGTYNTGFANLVGNNMYNYHPLSVYSDISGDYSNFRTSIYGFPVMVFHKHSTSADKALSEDEEYLAYEYIGRYNLNLDKSSNEFYGFEIEGTHPYVLKDKNNPSLGYKDIAEVAECWELEDNQGTWTSWKYPDAVSRQTGFGTLTNTGTLECIKHFEARYHPEADAIEVAYEAGDNAELVEVEGYGDNVIDLSTQQKKNDYLCAKFANLEKLFKWLDETDTTNVPATDTGVPLAEPVTYTTTVYYMVETFHDNENDQDIAYYVDVNGNQIAKISDITDQMIDEQHYYYLEENGENIMNNAIAPDNYTGTKRSKSDILITYNTDCAGYRLKKFVSEFSQHLDLEYCLVYFILTELLLCYDSRGKNMMMATWGPKEVDGEYIWFPIFYDIDTQLGLNNIGAVLWDYDTDATAEGTFSTANSVLWQNFFAGFRPAIEQKYRDLRSGSRLTETTIEGAYLCNPDVFKNSYAMRGVRPVIALGLDEWYKYIACGINKNPSWYSGTDRRFGYYVSSFDNGNSKTTDASYVYTCQGDRMLSRELFIRNRLNYLDSWWLAGAYDSHASAYKTEIMIRANANDTNTSDKFLDITKVSTDIAGYTRAQYPVEFYDATPQFTITPFLSQYVTVFYDEDPITPTLKYDGINPVLTNTTPSVENGYKAIAPYNEQLTYIPGGDFLSDIGDISLKYPSHFKLNTGKRLTQLLIGGDAPGYFNGIIGKESGTFDLNDSATGTNKKGLLQKLILTGLTALTEAQDVSGSQKLREYRALKTQIPYTRFADGAPLDTVHLPLSTTEVKLVYAKNLTRILDTAPEVMIEDNGSYIYNNHDNYSGLYIQGLTDYDENELYENNTYSICKSLDLQSVALGYDSYKLLNNAVNIRDRFRSDDFIAINFEDVNWCPYTVIESDVEYIPSQTFYVLTDHNDFEVYNHTSAEEWGDLKLNDKLYIYTPDAKEDYITDIELLKKFNDSYLAATGLATNYYRNTRGNETKTRPNITGVMYINNDENHPIDEATLSNVYGVAFPNLKIFAKYITHSYVVKYVQKLDSGRDDVIDLFRYTKQSGVHPGVTAKIPTKTNYDFVGWTEDPQYVTVEKSLVNDYKQQGIILTSADIAEKEFSAINEVYTFYAVFAITAYTARFWNNNQNIATDTPLATVTKDFGSIYEDPAVLPISYKEVDLELTQRYAFIGWVTDASDTECYPTSVAKANLVDLTTIVAQNTDRDFYACYVVESVYDHPTDSSYFNFDWDRSTSGWKISAKNIEAGHGNLNGKITIPKSYNGDGTYPAGPVVAINDGGFLNNNVTHIFFEPGSTIKNVYSSAFQATNIKYFECPESLEYIAADVFRECPQFEYFDVSISSLKTIGDRAFKLCPSLHYFDLPSSVISIGGEAFNQSFTTDTINKIYIPGSIVELKPNAYAFIKGYCPEVQFGGPNDPCDNIMLNYTNYDNNQTFIFSYNGIQINNMIFYNTTGSDPENQIENFLKSIIYTNNTPTVNIVGAFANQG